MLVLKYNNLLGYGVIYLFVGSGLFRLSTRGCGVKAMFKSATINKMVSSP